MFEAIFFPRNAERYRAAPLVEQRERYLRHLKELGTSRSTLRKCANDQLSLMRLLNLQGDDRVSIHRIEAAATIWSRPKGRKCNRPASFKARTRFVRRGIQWLRFLGWLDEPDHEHHPRHAEIAIFERWLRPQVSPHLRDPEGSGECRVLADELCVSLEERTQALLRHVGNEVVEQAALSE